MTLHYLRHLARLGTADIHPLGRQATWFLVGALDIRDNQRILEIGCGTGNTAAALARLFPVTVLGIDFLLEMIHAARSRARWSGAGRNLHFVRGDATSLPSRSVIFDRVFTESVLGFQDAQGAKRMLNEIWRVLKPGGLFVSNEAIWKAGLPQSTVDEVFARGVRDFGSSQASPQAWSLEQWLDVMRETGFTVLSSQMLEDALNRSSPPRPGLDLWKVEFRLRSSLFSACYRLKRFCQAGLREADRTYARRLDEHTKEGELIEARLFVLQKPG